MQRSVQRDGAPVAVRIGKPSCRRLAVEYKSRVLVLQARGDYVGITLLLLVLLYTRFTTVGTTQILYTNTTAYNRCVGTTLRTRIIISLYIIVAYCPGGYIIIQ